MLEFNIRGENVKVTESVRDYVVKRISKLQKFFKDSVGATAHVNLKIYPDWTYKVEVAIPLPYLTLRVEGAFSSMYGNIDLIADELGWQIRKYRAKASHKSREKGLKDLEFIPSDNDGTDGQDGELKIARTKQVSLKPMDPEKTILQMDMLGHNLFISRDAETNGTSIVYRRNDGRYSLIEAE